MRNRRAFLVFVLAATASAGLVVAAPMKSLAAGARGTAPSEFVSQIDGPMATASTASGGTWATWAYRAVGEFDIAIAFREASGLWSSPAYIGRRDGIDEIDPDIAVDEHGTVYVAFATRGAGRVSVSVLPAGGSTWLGPVTVSGAEQAATPTIRIFGDHLTVAFRTAAGIGITELPVLSPAVIMGIQDGPDGVDPLGMVPKWGNGPKHQESDDPPPSQ